MKTRQRDNADEVRASFHLNLLSKQAWKSPFPISPYSASTLGQLSHSLSSLSESLLWPHLIIQTFPGLLLFNVFVEWMSHSRDGLCLYLLPASPLAFKLLEGRDESDRLTVLPPGRSTGTRWWATLHLQSALSTLGDHRLDHRPQWLFLRSVQTTSFWVNTFKKIISTSHAWALLKDQNFQA